MNSGKKYFFLFCVWGITIAFYSQTPSINSSTCLGLNNEVYTTFVTKDSLFFQSTKNFKLAISVFKNKSNLNDNPVIACDNSTGPNKGRIYICWSDEKNGLNNTDVFIVYSDDKGQTWTEPILVTYRPNHKKQFMPIIKIEEKTGDIYLLYYDAQNYAYNGQADVYLATSNNGGLKFSYYKLNETPVTINSKLKKSLTLSVNEAIEVGWHEGIKKKPNNKKFIFNYNQADLQKNDTIKIILNKTFTFSELIKIDFSANAKTALTAIITKPLLADLEKIVVKNFLVKKGTNQLCIDTKKIGLKKGNYTLTLYYAGKNEYIWITEN